MDVAVKVALIGIGGIIIKLFWDQYFNNQKDKKQFDRTQKNLKYKIEIDELKEECSKIESKLSNFYYPLNDYLQRSRSAYEMFIEDKPKGFRTIEFLVNNEETYNGVKIILTKADHILLENIFNVGNEIEKLITEKGNIIDDPEFKEDYIAHPDYADKDYPEGMSLLNFTQCHLRYIRDAYSAYKSDSSKEMNKFKRYIYPRELNKRIRDIIVKLENSITEKKKEIDEVRKLIK